VIKEMKTHNLYTSAAIAWVSACFLFFLGLILPSLAQAGVWTPSNIPGTNNWTGLASSWDGTELLATSYDDPNFNPALIYASTNTGGKWSATGAPANYWFGVAASTNGENLAAVVFGGGIYASTNGGSAWVQLTTAPYGVWYAVASSWNGSNLVAVSGGLYRFIYTSPDSGQTWISNNVPDSEYWYAVASSANGQRLVAVSNSNTNGGAGALYTSTNAGTNWAKNKLSGIDWTGVGSSADGQKLVACGSSSALYVSADGGTNWTPISGVSGYLTGAAMSADGSKMVAAANGGQIYLSVDSGTNWMSSGAPPLAWQIITMSRDGNVIAAAAPSDQIYTMRFNAQSPPALSFVLSGGKGLLSWPAAGSASFILQHNVNLSTTNWQTVAGALLNNGQYQLTIPFTNSQDYFRLLGP
jgi:photosystem II stability/assembly factor-like uncharacterized protein